MKPKNFVKTTVRFSYLKKSMSSGGRPVFFWQVMMAFFLLMILGGRDVSGQSVTAPDAWCGTKKYHEKMSLPILQQGWERINSSFPAWDVQSSWGAGCSNDCLFDMPMCGGVSTTYKIPVVFVVSNTATCGGTMPTATELQAQINIMNDFMVCQGLPMEYYMSTSHASAPTTGDMSTVYGDYGCTYPGMAPTIPEVINIFVFYNSGNGTGCNGFAPLPFGTYTSTVISMSQACFSGFTYTDGSFDCPTSSLGFAKVLMHELGHYFGLFHTHETDIANNGMASNECDDPAISTDDCSNGDGIADTDADPDFSGGEIGCTGCVTSAQPSCAFDNTPVGCAAYGTPNTLNNIMSYNNYSGCARDFTDCQKAKMMDALLSVRGLQLCDRNVNQEFAGGSADTHLDICLGDPAPTFTATSSCYSWYSDLGAGATVLMNESASFTPALGTGAGQLNNMAAGTYTFYLGEVNEYNPLCRTELTITVSGDAGQAMSGMSNDIEICANQLHDFTSENYSLANADQMIGWYFSDASPIGINTNAAINTAITNATNGTGLDLVNGNVIQSNLGVPLTDLDNLSIDCDGLGGDGEYFLTPFIANGDAPITCTESGTNGGTFPAGAPFGTTYYTGSIGPVVCSHGALTDFTYTISINITSNTTGTPTTSLKARLNADGSCSSISSGTLSYEILSSTTHTFSAAHISSRLGAGFDPTTTPFCVSVVDINNSTTGLSYDVEVSVTYTGQTALEIWNTNGAPNIDATQATCFWGEPIRVTCTACPCPADGGNIIRPVGGTIDATTGNQSICKNSDLGAFTNVYAQTDESNPGTDFETMFLLANNMGEILEVSSIGDFDFSVLDVGVYDVYVLNYNTLINTPNNITDYLAALSTNTINEIVNDDIDINSLSGTAPGTGTYCLDISELDNTGLDAVSYKVQVSILDLPNANNITLQLCDANNDSDGDANTGTQAFDLTQAEDPAGIGNIGDGDAILNELAEDEIDNGATDVTISYYETLVCAQDPLGGGCVAISSTYNASNAQVLYARIVNNITGCYEIATITISMLSLPTAAAGSDLTLNCTTPTAVIGMISEVGNTYSWSPSVGLDDANISQPTVSAAGTYVLTVTNTINGCTATDEVIVTLDNTTPTAAAGSDLTLNCTTPTAVIGMTLEVGNTYSWSPSVGLDDATLSQPTVSAAGTYVLTVANTINGCTATDEVIITLDNTAPTAAAGSDLTLNCTTPTALIGMISEVGNVYSWSPSVGLDNATLSQPTVSAAGTYVLTVANTINGCTATDEVIVTLDNTAPTAAAGSDLTLNCTTPTAVIGMISEVGNTYSWSPSVGLDNATLSQPTVSAAGTYVLTVANTINGCTATDEVIVTLDNTVPTAAAGSDLTLNCTTPTAVIGMISEVGNTYSWSPSVGLDDATLSQPTVSAAGTYVLTVANTINGCTATDEVIVTLDNTAPTAAAGSDLTLNCTTPTAVIGMISEVGNTYSWSPNVGLDDATISQPTVSAAGTYVLTVANTINGCTATDEVIVTLDNTAPTAAAGSDLTLNCTTPTAVIGMTSEVGNTYSWSPSVGLDNATLSQPTVSAAGTYVLTVANTINGCTATDEVIVTLDNTVPTAAAGSDLTLNCTTPTGVIGMISEVGNVYSWSPSVGLDNATISKPTVSAAGTYVLTVANTINGCTATDEVIVTLDNTAPTAAAGSDLTLNCTTPTAVIGMISEVGNTYSWSPSVGLDDATISQPTVSAAGTYVLTVANTISGCTATDEVIVTLDNTAPTADAGPDKVLNCYILTTIIGTPAVAGNEYSWNPSAGLSAQNIAQPFATTYGTYLLMVTNLSNGCTASDVVVVDFGFATPVLSVTDNSCMPTVDGSFNVVSGCGFGSHVEYSTDGGATWLATIPAYADGVSVVSRCVSNTDAACYSENSNVVTANATLTTSNTTTASACDSYLWTEDGVTYTISGTYTSISGCHTEILELSIATSPSATISGGGNFCAPDLGATVNISGTPGATVTMSGIDYILDSDGSIDVLLGVGSYTIEEITIADCTVAGSGNVVVTSVCGSTLMSSADPCYCGGLGSNYFANIQVTATDMPITFTSVSSSIVNGISAGLSFDVGDAEVTDLGGGIYQLDLNIEVLTGQDYNWIVEDALGSTDAYVGAACDCTGSIGEVVYSDANGNGIVDAGEGIVGVIIWISEPFIDADGNGTWDMGEIYLDTNGDGSWTELESSQTTNANGNYSFDNAGFGTYVVTAVPPTGYSVLGSSSFTTTLNSSSPIEIAANFVLPISFLNFQAKTTCNTVLMSWTAGQEENILYYIIQRSLDGMNWENIGSVETTASSNTYEYTDYQGAYNETYYRILAIGTSGESKYSNAMMVFSECESETEMSVYPNPIQDVLHVSILSEIEEMKTIQILDILGRVHMERNVTLGIGVNELKIPTVDLASGIYFIGLKNEESSKYIKIIKMK